MENSGSDVEEEFAEYYITGIHLYQSDREVMNFYREFVKDGMLELYDLDLCDGQNYRKVFLHPQYNDLIQSGKLQLGHVIVAELDTADYRYYANIQKEIHLPKKTPYIIAKRIEIQSDPNELTLDELKKLSYLTSNELNDRERKFFPLACIKNTYLSVWNWHIPYFGAGLPSVIKQKEFLTSGQKQVIVDIDWVNDTKYKISSPPPLLLRVISKGAIHLYGKCDKSKSLCPFRGVVTCAGNFTTACNVIIWDSANAHSYKQIVPGCYLYLNGYTVRKRQNFTTPYVKPLPFQLQMSDFEISVNSNYSQLRGFILPLRSTFQGWEFPELPHRNFKTIAEILHLQNGSVFDLVCLVVGVSRWERVMRRDITNNREWGYFSRHMVSVRDWSAGIIQQVELFVNSQEEIHEKIIPGVVLILSNLHITNKMTFGHQSSRKFHLFSEISSSYDTFIEIVDVNSDSCRSKNVKKVLSMSKLNYQSEMFIGGLGRLNFTFPDLKEGYFNAVTERLDKFIEEKNGEDVDYEGNRIQTRILTNHEIQVLNRATRAKHCYMHPINEPCSPDCLLNPLIPDQNPAIHPLINLERLLKYREYYRALVSGCIISAISVSETGLQKDVHKINKYQQILDCLKHDDIKQIGLSEPHATTFPESYKGGQHQLNQILFPPTTLQQFIRSKERSADVGILNSCTRTQEYIKVKLIDLTEKVVINTLCLPDSLQGFDLCESPGPCLFVLDFYKPNFEQLEIILRKIYKY